MTANLQFNKDSWTPVKFGDVVSEVRNTVKNGEKENIERFVGLEHIDPENIHITKWGYVKDGTTFTRKFEKDQVLFGRRRAYLKKAGLATFTGLCSGDIIVMEAKEILLPELLPFLINNSLFFDYAVDTSAGSLSPRTKFKHLAEYQFLLPPKDQQAKIAELLWAMDDVVEKMNILKDNSIRYRLSYMKNIYRKNDFNTETKELGELIKLSSGKTRPTNLKSTIDGDYKYPVYGGNGIIGYSIRYLTEKDTIVIGRVGEYCGVIHDVNSKAWISDNALYIKKFYTDLDKTFLSRFLEYINLNKQQNKSSHPLITQTKVYKNVIGIPIHKEIKENVSNILQIEDNLEKIISRLTLSKQLQKSLINEIFAE